MNITILATLCSLASGQCHQEQITSSDYQDMTMTACLVGLPAIAAWMRDKPQYRLAGWRCVLGRKAGAA